MCRYCSTLKCLVVNPVVKLCRRLLLNPRRMNRYTYGLLYPLGVSSRSKSSPSGQQYDVISSAGPVPSLPPRLRFIAPLLRTTVSVCERAGPCSSATPRQNHKQCAASSQPCLGPLGPGHSGSYVRRPQPNAVTRATSLQGLDLVRGESNMCSGESNRSCFCVWWLTDGLVRVRAEDDSLTGPNQRYLTPPGGAESKTRDVVSVKYATIMSSVTCF